MEVVEEVKVSRYEDEAVQGLGDERYAFGAVVSVDCEDQNAFGEGMGDVPQDAEYLVGR